MGLTKTAALSNATRRNMLILAGSAVGDGGATGRLLAQRGGGSAAGSLSPRFFAARWRWIRQLFGTAAIPVDGAAY